MVVACTGGEYRVVVSEGNVVEESQFAGPIRTLAADSNLEVMLARDAEPFPSVGDILFIMNNHSFYKSVSVRTKDHVTSFAAAEGSGAWFHVER